MDKRDFKEILNKSTSTEINYPIGAYAPGYYSCKCGNCEEEFTGDKRSVRCFPCSVNDMKERLEEQMMELYEFRKFKESIKTILKTLDN